MKKAKKMMKAKTGAKGHTKAGLKSRSTKKVQTKLTRNPRSQASQKLMSAAQHIKRVTQKIVDDSFLKGLGLKVLSQAQEMTLALQKEKRVKKSNP